MGKDSKPPNEKQVKLQPFLFWDKLLGISVERFFQYIVEGPRRGGRVTKNRQKARRGRYGRAETARAKRKPKKASDRGGGGGGGGGEGGGGQWVRE